MTFVADLDKSWSNVSRSSIYLAITVHEYSLETDEHMDRQWSLRNRVPFLSTEP